MLNDYVLNCAIIGYPCLINIMICQVYYLEWNLYKIVKIAGFVLSAIGILWWT